MKAAEYFKYCFLGHRRREDRASRSYLNSWELTENVSEEKNFNRLTRDRPCDILVKKEAAFCPCLKSLPEAKMKSFGLIPLAEEISKQPSLDSAVWLQVLTLMKI